MKLAWSESSHGHTRTHGLLTLETGSTDIVRGWRGWDANQNILVQRKK